MSKYTTEVRFICENAAGLTESTGYSRIDDVINKAIPAVFSFDFPIFDEKYRNVLCKKILKHYYTREICEETVGLWKFRLDTRMNEIMPYFNKLYKSELLEFNPLYDVDITRKGNRENTAKGNESIDSTRTGSGNSETDTTNNTSTTNTSNETSEGTNNTTNQSTTNAKSTDNKTERDLYSETPQGALTNVENETYLTNARKKIGEATTTDTGTSTGTTNSAVTGKVDISGSGETNQEGNSTNTYTNNDTFNSSQVKNAESTEDYLENVSGKQGGASYSKMLMEYRDTFLNIDMQVINSLSDLFFGLW